MKWKDLIAVMHVFRFRGGSQLNSEVLTPWWMSSP